MGTAEDSGECGFRHAGGGSCSARAGALVITDDRASGVDATAAAATHRQLHLHIREAARALIDCATDLTISDSVADTDVHGEASNLPGRPVHECQPER